MMACAAIRSATQLRHGTGRPACRTASPGQIASPAATSLTSGSRTRARTLPATDLLTASFVWGWGPVGYGPRRLRGIRAAAGDRLESSLRPALDAAGKDPALSDPIAGYACLYGGYDYEGRAAPGQEPWSRLRGFGPAFFTKFLYFCTPGALILDNLRAPHFPDREFAVNSRGFLPVQELIHDFLRSPAPESRMETSLIVAELDPPRNVFPCFLPDRVHRPVDQLDFQRAVDGFGECTMPLN
jgi:hypothetical protein